MSYSFNQLVLFQRSIIPSHFFHYESRRQHRDRQRVQRFSVQPVNDCIMNMHSSAIGQAHRGRRGKMAYDIWPGMKCKNARRRRPLQQRSDIAKCSS